MTVGTARNPRCSRSRQAVELLRGDGAEPTTVEPLETAPDAAELGRILKLVGKSPRDALRKEAAEAGIDPPAGLGDVLLRAMMCHPAATERPSSASRAPRSDGRKAMLPS